MIFHRQSARGQTQPQGLKRTRKNELSTIQEDWVPAHENPLEAFATSITETRDGIDGLAALRVPFTS